MKQDARVHVLVAQGLVEQANVLIHAVLRVLETATVNVQVTALTIALVVEQPAT